MDAKERAIRELYDARARRDWVAVGAVLAEDVVWHEPGEEDYSGDHRGRDAVLALHPRRDHGFALTSVVGVAAAAEPAARRAVQLLVRRGPHRCGGRELRGIRRRHPSRAGPQPRDPVTRIGHDAAFVRVRRLAECRGDARRERLEVEERERRVGHPHTLPPTIPGGRSRRTRGAT